MDHVIPFSRGGETSVANLVTLCESCNQGYGNEHHPEMFALAGLHHGWDPELVKAKIRDVNADTQACAIYLSNNIMVSRCQISQIPATVKQEGQR